MPWLLNLVYLAVIAAATPVLVYRRLRTGKPIAGWREKLFGSTPALEPACERVWFHAVSVGEVLLLRGVIAELRSRRPDVEIVLTTTTGTGHEVAVAHYPDLTVCYFPFDFSWAVRRAIRRLKPTAIVLAELELWPNLIVAASNAGIRLAIVNGRLGEKSFRGYRRLRPLVSRLLKRFAVVAVQTEEYGERFRELGTPSDRLTVTGSVKYDGVRTDRSNPQTLELRRAFGLDDDEPVFVAGSTQQPEEEYSLETWETLRREFPSLRLILVPRHKERFDEVARLVERRGLPLVRRSDRRSEPFPSPPSPSPPRPSGSGYATWIVEQQGMSHNRSLKVAALNALPSPVLLLDTLGELGACWGLADVAFVGGSLTDRGGQNMIEPAAYGAAVLFGPNTWNFRDAVRLLLAANAAQVVCNQEELKAAVRDLLTDPTRRRNLGQRAQAAVAAHRGATARTVELLVGQLTDRRIDGHDRLAA